MVSGLLLSVQKACRTNRKSQHLEAPGRLLFVVQTVRRVEVELPGRRRHRRLIFVVQKLCGVEGEAGRRVRLVVVSRHGAAAHGTELVVVGVHGRQVRAALHPAKVRAWCCGRVALAVGRRRLAVGRRVGG